MRDETTASTRASYTVGSGNVFDDLGFEHPEEALAKAKLAMVIGQAIRQRELT